MIYIADAISSLCPNISFRVGSSYESIEFINKSDSFIPPSKVEVELKIAELQAQYEANEYQRQRAAEYPSWQDQLDKIYHEGIDAWKAEIQAIKDQYPKPDGV